MTESEFKALAAAELHEATPETTGIEIDVTVTEGCGILIDSVHIYSQVMPHYYTGKPSLNILSSVHSLQIDDVRELIALLQRAQTIMMGGG